MAKKDFDLEVAFFRYLRVFYQNNRGEIRKNYKHLSRHFLDFNSPENPGVFLRRPQFEALEIYVFLKEYLHNKPVHKLFEDWYYKRDRFQNRKNLSIDNQQQSFLTELDHKSYEAAFKHAKTWARNYPSYIFALTMGTGKTILMATCIFYEFLLAREHPKAPEYCHNALVFAPDTTVLQSLKEIQTFDKSLVVPAKDVNWLEANVTFHFLEGSGITLNTLDRSRFNIIISNTQKIILKRIHADKPAVTKLFEQNEARAAGNVYSQYADLYQPNSPTDEGELAVNQRFQKLQRLTQLGVYVDEAHHAFGSKLKRDMMGGGKTSLRLTIDELAASLKRSNTRMVACYNFTGTPYVGKDVLPEVVYAYGLKAAIDNEYLKKVNINGYTNPKSEEFLKLAIDDFWSKYGENGQRFEGMLPKLAIFASTIEELQDEVRPIVERSLAEKGIDTNRILVNVGDSKLTSNDDIREFRALDTAASNKQFILLVNKGREGWNCRSLFGVGLYRKPRSKIFVLQATMRCLRSISDFQQTGNVYLSKENMDILNTELQQNHRLSITDFQNAGSDRQAVEVNVAKPPVKIKIRRVRKLQKLTDKQLPEEVDFKFSEVDYDRYRLLHIQQEGLKTRHSERVKKQEVDISEQKQRRQFSVLTLTAEIARYLNRSPLEIEGILHASRNGIEEILDKVNEFNELLYDWVIPLLFHELYKIDSFDNPEEEEIELVRQPTKGLYNFVADKNLIVESSKEPVATYAGKSFHADPYCFASVPEKKLFFDLIRQQAVQRVYFTGMFTHGQSEFCIYYIDPHTKAVRSYYPDFIVQKEDGTWVIIEVKGDNKIDDPVVQAKGESARQLAAANLWSYEVVPSSKIEKAIYKV